MSAQTVIVNEVDVKGYKLSVTSRDAGDDPKHLEEITYRTIVVWLMIADKLEQGDYTLAGGSVEQEYVAFLNKQVDTDAPRTEPFELPDAWGDPRCTVWNKTFKVEDTKFRLCSDDVPQTAINTWLANQNACQRAYDKFASAQQKIAETAPQVPQERPATPKGTNPPTPPAAPVEGAIVATRAPNSKRPDYANGQLVSFTVTKIVATANKGSAVYQMWTPLGSQYPTISVYKLKPDGNLKPDYEAIVPVLNTLNLSLDKPEAAGTWRLICKAAHVPGTEGDREFLNIVSLTAI